MQRISFKDSKNRTLSGTLSKAGPNIILLVHGLGSDKNESFYKRLQKSLNKLDYSTFCIDLIGHGESSGEYNDLNLTETMDDIVSAHKLLKSLNYNNISFIGHSFGAVGGIMVAPKLKFEFMVLISPPTYFDITEMISTSYNVLKELYKFKSNKKKPSIEIEFFKDYGSHDSYKAAKKIREPVCIIQGDKDNIIPISKTIELHKHIKNSYLKLLPNIDHHYRNHKDETIVIKTVVEFVKGQ